MTQSQVFLYIIRIFMFIGYIQVSKADISQVCNLHEKATKKAINI